jgi:hypothetical protein
LIFSNFATIYNIIEFAMRIKSEYKVREIVGEHVVILQGRYGADMTRIITLNESALLMWNELYDRDFTAKDAATVLQDHYEVDAETALKDAQAWIDKMNECKLLD